MTLRVGGLHPDSKMTVMETIKEMRGGMWVSAAPHLAEMFAEHIQEVENARNE